MTDLLRVLPDFPVKQFGGLISALESRGYTTADLLTLNPAEIETRTKLPNVKRLCDAILNALHADLGVANDVQSNIEPPPPSPHHHETGHLRHTADTLSSQWSTISTLDPHLDLALGGGIPTGHITEITGESAAGKTQFLLTLLLAVQLPPPHGLSRPALYISTEAPLSTRRLSQMITENPMFSTLPRSARPTLDKIISTTTPDLESQDHILTYQAPVEIARRNIGLLIIDSVAANYRAEFERSTTTTTTNSNISSNMGARTNELIKLGMHLKDLAERYNLAVVVSNQVADRFSNFPGIGSKTTPAPNPPKTPASSLKATFPHVLGKQSQESPLASRSKPVGEIPIPPQPQLNPEFPDAEAEINAHPALSLDHQQKWFTGWGDNLALDYPLKTPSLGLVWSTQISGRIALFRRPVDYGWDGDQVGAGEGMGARRGGWRRWMKVVWGVNAPASDVAEGRGGKNKKKGGPVEFEVWKGGVRAVVDAEGE
ncbi:P-loop containing nucleoside triphosphate hydrolase protein [Cercophora samala]|uniref:P-loop containing nucleoside triphosphate hydrolase protein n=1 Tax=Cercophora samala TaxID=330535 RepID=A0AA40DI90_9PEZI|nr:P-loop containing nucleoside triphosphate hydrolase protein [Cercophora samala]